MVYDLIIIGGGAAGLSAAIYAGRSALRTLVLEGSGFGGQMNLTYEVDNYPGFFDAPSGATLSEHMKKHAEKFDIEFSSEQVRQIQNHASPIKTVVTRKNTYDTRTILFATGANPRKLDVPGEIELAGVGVSYCATCDGAFFKDRTVAVIGGGNTAFEDALYLARFCSKVYLVHRREEFRAAKSLVERAMAEPKIELLTSCIVEEILGEAAVSGLRLRHVSDGSETALSCDGVFIAVGRVANTSLAGKYVALSEDGFIQTDEKMQTNIPGIFAAGDVRTTPLRQVVTAAADGAVAATSAGIYLSAHAK